MGYSTTFKGRFKLSRPLTKEQIEYLKIFAAVQHPQRHINLCIDIHDPIREAAGIELDSEGYNCLFGYNHEDITIKCPLINRNDFCNWIPNDEGTHIIWNENCKFKGPEYFKWISHISLNILNQWNISIKGTVYYKGEERGDSGKLVAEKNTIILYPKGEAPEYFIF